MLEYKEVINGNLINNATIDQLNSIYSDFIISNPNSDMEFSDESYEIIERCLSEIDRCPNTGRLIVPALWKNEIEHLLSKNFRLSLSILNSHRKKLSKNKMLQYDQVIREQLNDGVIEEINLNADKNDSTVSFLPHSAIFKDSSTSKCRIVFLSNLKSDQSKFSHNQISKPGANLNHKLQVALLLLRFDKYLVTFDLKKAFLQLILREEDTSKLRFIWFKNIEEGNFSPVGYRLRRVPFGMRYSPFLLMLSLYYILIKDRNEDSESQNIRRAIYDLAYVDNLAYSSNEPDQIQKALIESKNIFAQYGFDLHSIYSNCTSSLRKLEDKIDIGESEENNLLGTIWNTGTDTLRTRKLYLDPEANSKRSILSTFQSNFDPFGINIPLLNRAKLFMHSLQSDRDLDWDTTIDDNKRKEWRIISRQVNKSADICVSRSVGSRSHSFSLIVYCDASKDFIACCVYLYDHVTKIQSLIMSRNSVVSGGLKSKSIPLLELAAIKLGTETAIDIYCDLSLKTVRPINILNIKLYTDSLVCLRWLRSKIILHDKIDRKNVFILNKLNSIITLCERKGIMFDHIQGLNNPSDCLTKPTSANQLAKLNYINGASLDLEHSELSIMVPNPLNTVISTTVASKCSFEPLLDLKKHSFDKNCRIFSYIYRFLSIKFPNKFDCEKSFDFSRYHIIRQTQRESFPDLVQSITSGDCNNDLINQLNLFIDKDGIIRIQSKLRKLRASYGEKCPILLDKCSDTTRSIIEKIHIKSGHSGVYKTISLLRKEFWITRILSTVRKVLKNCFICSKYNNRSIKISQNAYKNFRINPNEISFRNICIDHCGPFKEKNSGSNSKVYILVVTCFSSRATSLIVSEDLSKESFLRALQYHILPLVHHPS